MRLVQFPLAWPSQGRRAHASALDGVAQAEAPLFVRARLRAPARHVRACARAVGARGARSVAGPAAVAAPTRAGRRRAARAARPASGRTTARAARRSRPARSAGCAMRAGQRQQVEHGGPRAERIDVGRLERTPRRASSATMSSRWLRPCTRIAMSRVALLRETPLDDVGDGLASKRRLLRRNACTCTPPSSPAPAAPRRSPSTSRRRAARRHAAAARARSSWLTQSTIGCVERKFTRSVSGSSSTSPRPRSRTSRNSPTSALRNR